MKNKNGQIGLIIVVLLLLVGVGAFVGVAWQQGWFTSSTQSAIQKKTSVLDCPDSTGILTVNAFSSLNKGSAVSTPTITAGVNGQPITTSVTSGTTTFPVGQDLTIHVSKADYLDKAFTTKMECGGITLEAPLYYSTSDNPAVRVKNDDGNYVTDSVTGGATNQTALSVGEKLQVDVEFSGTSLESSGEGIYVVEVGKSANITKIELSGATPVALPRVHATQVAGSKVQAFKVPAVLGSDKATHTLTVTPTASGHISGGVYTDWYAQQDFIDTNGKVAYGIENSEGTLKYENTLDFDFYIMLS